MSNDNDGGIGIEPSTETVYGTHDDNTMVMSEKVWVAQLSLKMQEEEKKNGKQKLQLVILCIRYEPWWTTTQPNFGTTKQPKISIYLHDI